MNDGLMLNLLSVTKRYDNRVIIQDINLHVRKGEFVALIGVSGSGKTTLLQIAGLLSTPTSGEIWVNKMNCTRASDKERTYIRRNSLSFIYQFHHLLQELSVLENVMLPQIISGSSKTEAKRNAYNILQDIGLHSKAHYMISEISGGERQRIAIARSLAKSPSILLADEPTGNLDPTNASCIFSLLHLYSKKHEIAMVVVTHNHLLAQKADSIFELKNKKLSLLDSR
ncbi:ABC transporter ATP-binding protein [Wolbachia endosymbiont of Pentidionis agamae]|uniref:ABC transporter ATP-binding protein n=1 Tax=Wolbachia endosymbiont of Pentidionis agamae TaxID=3110435 RepID=UPI002FCEC30C